MSGCLKIVVTGEVDSGKSTLIGRFLYESGSLSRGAIGEIESTCRAKASNFEFAYLLDSLEEERQGQLTIDTTQVFCKTRRGREFIFIDVPGHQELIKNMLSGSSYADIAVLVVDAERLLETQTRRHAFILHFLGIRDIITVLNKMDLAGFRADKFEESKERINAFFAQIGIKPKYVIPVSAKEGDNLRKASKSMPWYKGLSLLEALNKVPLVRIKGDFRFPVQDIYSFNGERVAVGKVISGRIKRSERIAALPLKKEFRVDKIKVFQEDRSAAQAPESIGLVLNNMEDIRRGQIICKPELPRLATEITAKIFCNRPLTAGDSFTFRCSTQRLACRIKKINGVWDTATLVPQSRDGQLAAGDVAQVSILTDGPAVIEKFEGLNNLGRFVLERRGEICAVGIIS